MMNNDDISVKAVELLFTKQRRIEIPNALGELISPEPVEVNVKIGKKDDYAGSVYAYYIDENNHIYNTSYVMFEIEYRKQ